MKGHYQKVPDTTRKKKFPEPRVEPNQYKEPIGPRKISLGERFLDGVGSFNRAIQPHVPAAKRAGGKIHQYAAERSRAIDQNFGMGQINPTQMGAGWANMSFPGSGFDEPEPRRKPKRRSRY
jgi:hypothetical protein